MGKKIYKILKKMPMDVYAHQREWLKYRIINEMSAHMAADIAGLIAMYCMPADAPKTIESAQGVKGYAIRLEPMTEHRYARRYGFNRGAAPQPPNPEPPQLDMWGEPEPTERDNWAEPYQPYQPPEPYGTGGTTQWLQHGQA
jgi:hypothetical protein